MVRWPSVPSAIAGVLALCVVGIAASEREVGRAARQASPASQSRTPVEAAQATVATTCVGCHNDRAKSGSLSLQSFNVATAGQQAEIAEKMIRKLRAGQMPPPGLQAAAPTQRSTGSRRFWRRQADAHAATEPAPGRRRFQRLNRAEYARSIHDLLALDVNAGEYLPLDAKSANFDNIADAQLLSPTLMQGYLTAAAEISRLAVGDPAATAREATYPVSRWTSQREHVEGAPYGTRGGVSVEHTFPADGDYRFRVSFYHETTGALYGNGRAALHTADAPEQVEISIDGARVALLDVDRWMNTSDPDGVNLRTEPIAVTAGPHRVSAAFIRRLEGPGTGSDLTARVVAGQHQHRRRLRLHDAAASARPRDHRAVHRDRRVADAEPREDLHVPSRDRACLATKRGTRDGGQMVCAREIVSRLASQAFRRHGDRARSERADGALQEGRGRGRLRGGRPHGARRHPGEPALRVPLRGAAGVAHAPAQATR